MVTITMDTSMHIALIISSNLTPKLLTCPVVRRLGEIGLAGNIFSFAVKPSSLLYYPLLQMTNLIQLSEEILMTN
jgi:hypothetical protein